MESGLIVSSSEKSIAFFTDMLQAVSCNKISVVQNCAAARILLIERDFDLCIVNASLSQGSEKLSQDIASAGESQVILVVNSEFYEAVSSAVEDYGVITISKPISRSMFYAALKLAKAAGSRIKAVKAENSRLLQKIEDIRIVDRAKYTLISYLNMSEPQAHKYIERQAMDMRITKRAVAERILKTYES